MWNSAKICFSVTYVVRASSTGWEVMSGSVPFPKLSLQSFEASSYRVYSPMKPYLPTESSEEYFAVKHETSSYNKCIFHTAAMPNLPNFTTFCFSAWWEIVFQARLTCKLQTKTLSQTKLLCKNNVYRKKSMSCWLITAGFSLNWGH